MQLVCQAKEKSTLSPSFSPFIWQSLPISEADHRIWLSSPLQRLPGSLARHWMRCAIIPKSVYNRFSLECTAPIKVDGSFWLGHSQKRDHASIIISVSHRAAHETQLISFWLLLLPTRRVKLRQAGLLRLLLPATSSLCYHSCHTDLVLYSKKM